MKKYLPLAPLAFAVSVSSFATEFQSEIEIDYSNLDVDYTYEDNTKDSEDGNLYGITGTYYFTPVKVGNGPTAEAAFLNKASSIYLSSLRAKSDSDQDNDSVKITSYTAGSRFIIADRFSILGKYAQTDGTFNGSDYYESETISIGVGMYITDSHELSLNVANDEFDYERSDSETDIKTYTLAYHGVVGLGNAQNLAVDASYAFADRENDGEYFSDDKNSKMTTVGVTYYPINSLGIGANLRQIDEDYSDELAYAFGVKYFFSPNFSVGGEFEFSKTDYDNTYFNDETEMQSLNVSTSFRF